MLATQLLPQYKCQTCNKQMKEQRGCTAKPKLPLELDGELLERCPMRGFYEDPVGYNALFHRYRMAKDGFLSDPGLWPDQAAAFVSLSTVIMQANDEAQDTVRKKREREANDQRRKAEASKPPGSGVPRRPARQLPSKPRGGRRPRR